MREKKFIWNVPPSWRGLEEAVIKEHCVNTVVLKYMGCAVKQAMLCHATPIHVSVCLNKNKPPQETSIYSAIYTVIHSSTWQLIWSQCTRIPRGYSIKNVPEKKSIKHYITCSPNITCRSISPSLVFATKNLTLNFSIASHVTTFWDFLFFVWNCYYLTNKSHRFHM